MPAQVAMCVTQAASQWQAKEASVRPTKLADVESSEPDSPGATTVTDRLERLKSAPACAAITNIVDLRSGSVHCQRSMQQCSGQHALRKHERSHLCY